MTGHWSLMAIGLRSQELEPESLTKAQLVKIKLINTGYLNPFKNHQLLCAVSSGGASAAITDHQNSNKQIEDFPSLVQHRQRRRTCNNLSTV